MTLAIIGFLYYLLTFTISSEKLPSEMKQMRSYCRTILLFVCFMEIFLGVYIQSSKHRVFLFLQALATMLLLVAHGFYVYAFFNLDGSISFSSQSAMDAGMIIFILVAILHIATLFEHRFKVEKPVEKPAYIDDELHFEEDY
jgi:hypothetical protein